MNKEGAVSVPNLNLKSERGERKVELSGEIIAAAEKFLDEDNELYRQALDKFSEQSSKAYAIK